MWTVLFITLVGGPMSGVTTGLLYTSHEACLAAQRIITSTLPYDFTVRCELTDTPSIGPKRSPVYGD